MPFAHLRAVLARQSKWRRFSVFVLLAGLVAIVTSVTVYMTVLEGAPSVPARLVLLAPLSGPDGEIGRSMRRGAEAWAAEARQRQGGPGGHLFELAVIDEAAPDPVIAEALRDPMTAGVVGPYGAAATRRLRPLLAASGVPAVAPVGREEDARAAEGLIFELASREEAELRFLANYVRNVLGERLVSIVLPADAQSERMAGIFDSTLQTFGTRVVYRWAVQDGDAASRAEGLRNAAADITSRHVAGSILVLGGQSFAAEAVGALRAGNVGNRIVGTRTLATNAFRHTLRTKWRAAGLVEAALNGAIVTVPALFDTAGSAAQAFRDDLAAASGETPDWTAVLAYDAAALIEASLKGTNAKARPLRSELRDRLAARDSMPRAHAGHAGAAFFGPSGGALPDYVATYDGADLIAALTQLSPIREQGITNYLDELTSGRALYVNDRFMYRTNVVYTGVQLDKVLDLNPTTGVAELDVALWFRWRGTFDPQDVVFPNALIPIRLGAPEREGSVDGLNYRAYRVRGRFYMNISGAPHRYGTQVVEIRLRHRSLTRNNLLYVTDGLGMGLVGAGVGLDIADGKAPSRNAAPAWLARPVAGESVLARQLAANAVLAGAPGWLIDRAWVSQELNTASSGGDPVHVGFGKPSAVFSTIGLGLVVKPDTFDAAGLVPTGWFIHVAILAAAMSVLAWLLDRRDRGHFWRMQTLLLRLFAWPLLLLAVSNLALDYAQEHMTAGGVSLIDNIAGMMWWLVPARLLLISVHRFVWAPIEAGAGRKVPTVFIIIVDVLIYVLAGFGIVAFVLGKTITSLLAGSGVLAMIVGLALQSNLKDIFSGIMLNLERPFVLRDMLRLNRTFARVVDVSWRSTRFETDTGSIIALPNSKVAESEIENLSTQRVYEVISTVTLDPAYPPEQVVAALRTAAASFPFPLKVASATLSRIERIGESFVATYTLGLEMEDFPTSKKVRAIVMERIWHALHDAGIDWNTARPRAI